MNISIETYIVDAFTNRPFKGNPAAVCVLEDPLSINQMQSIAKEFGLSETAFITLNNSELNYSIRYFSPAMEIPLCGHATLAASKVLFEKNPKMDMINFTTVQNIELIIQKKGDQIEMEFPIYDTVPQKAPKALLSALGLKQIVNSEFNIETNILLLEIESVVQLKNVSPDFEKLKQSHHSINGVLVTAISNKNDFDFESRYFWPWSGTNEDPVTGATHTFLAKYWSTRLNKKKMNSFQCSERTGFMEVELFDHGKLTLKSEAQIVLNGSLRL